MAGKTGAFPKAAAGATAFFESLVAGKDGVAVRPMFGHKAAFVNGNMFCGVFGQAVFVRLGETERAALLREAGAGPFEPMPGRPMKEYVVLPVAWRKVPHRARPWVARSLAWASALPAKDARRPAPGPKPAAKAKPRAKAKQR